MDTDSVPRWGWLALALVVASVASQLLNFLVLFPLGLPEYYGAVTNVAAMAPVLVYVGFWFDEEKQSYWDRSRARLAGDLFFVVFGATLGAAVALVALEDVITSELFRDVPALLAGFVAAYVLFWWRNPDYVGA